MKLMEFDKIAIPTNNSTQEAWDEAYAKLGRPESPEKYALDAKSDVKMYNFFKLNKGDIKFLNRLKISSKIEMVILKLLIKKFRIRWIYS